ncbi:MULTISPECIES: sulfite exporter TauE/SafE family protein [unclassified Streptomyces]|uniref:sulfite exporter TauE/SafE family protein n=1 Tax=unclassified Streptomyces TaxID=2593676 RepID=UPI000DC7A39F|nr:MULTISPECIES: sulfite exporter TauE/SafE family protein [unclassified Streptomyces]AWZ04907.1 sulfite exporter TauE/SafE family protein [Streptomyces sp. ICC4]AWZ13290.1 sulfite exporter TauE/SafE family protein [Streptomyces sp. ICC1]
MDWSTGLLGFAAGLLIAVVTAPVGVSGAVFLLPIQLSVLAVPNPAVTPTNLLYNVVAGPGALLRYHRDGRLRGRLTRLLLAGTLPGVVLGAVIRVFAVPGPTVFRALVAILLLPLGLWLIARTLRATADTAHTAGSGGTGGQGLRPRSTVVLSVAVGTVGGIYGIGGGSILGPVLVGRGMPVAQVAPAALASTFCTSLAGAATYGLLSLTATGSIAPDWPLGLACGLGGLIGGYLGARLQPRLPERFLRFLLGALAAGVGTFYAVDILA